MKQRFDKSVGGLVVVGLPLLLIAGCATDKANLAQVDPQAPQMQGQAKAPLDQTSSPVAESAASPAGQTTAQLAADETVSKVAAQAQRNAETIASPETQAADSAEPATPVSPDTKVPAPSDAQASTLAAGAVVAVNDKPSSNEKAAVALPQQMVFYFGFNKDDIGMADQAVVKQHAEYLLAHPEYTLLITGHADNRGPKAYNQRLSEARASKVEQLLEEDGVPKQQLRIQALGATSPMVDAANYQQNRRVEFTYQDAVVAKGQ